MRNCGKKVFIFVTIFFSLIVIFGMTPYVFPVKAKAPVVVINPGHLVGRDSGAVNGKIQEADLNAIVASKTAEKLKDLGYDVFLTHPVSGCSVPSLLTTQQVINGYNSNISLKTIGDAINRKNPDLALSIHHNSGGNASGYEFYWSSYRSGIDSEDVYKVYDRWPNDFAYVDASPCLAAKESKKFTEILQKNFDNIGLPYRKTVERDDYIPAHTVCPSVLIEAGFVSNDSELAKLTDPNYQEEEARRIVLSVNDFFGFETKITAEKIDVSYISDSKIKVTVSGLKGGSLLGLSIPVWSEKDGQDDINWYWANRESGNVFSVTVDVKNHKYDSGIYNVHVYGVDTAGTFHMLGMSTVDVPKIEPPKITAEQIITGEVKDGKFEVTVSGLKVPEGLNLNSVTVPVWSDKDGQNDINWYSASKAWDGTYKVTIDVKNHKYDSGVYNVHAYGIDTDGTFYMLGMSTVDVPKIEPPKITAEQIITGEVKDGKFEV
ncbi:MAG: GBS Bsp-like repeat-containing protein, partial [Eubacterium sp.]